MTAHRGMSPRSSADAEVSTLRIKIGKVAGALNSVSDWTGAGGEASGALLRDLGLQVEQMAIWVEGMQQVQTQRDTEFSAQLSEVLEKQSDLADVVGQMKLSQERTSIGIASSRGRSPEGSRSHLAPLRQVEARLSTLELCSKQLASSVASCTAGFRDELEAFQAQTADHEAVILERVEALQHSVLGLADDSQQTLGSGISQVERLQALERTVVESGDLQSRVACELERWEAHFASSADRLGFVESAVRGASERQERHAKALEANRTANEQLIQELQLQGNRNATVAGRLDWLEARYTSIAEQMEALPQQQQQQHRCGEIVQSLNPAVSSHQFVDLGRFVEEVAQRHAKELDSLRVTHSQHASQLDTLKGTATTLAAELPVVREAASRQAALAERLADVELFVSERLADVERTFGELVARHTRQLDALENTGSTATDSPAIPERLAGVEQKLDDAINRHAAQLETLQSTLSALATELPAAVFDTGARQHALAEKVASTEHQVNESTLKQTSQLDSLKKTCSSIASQLPVALAAIREASSRQAADSDRLTTLQRQLDESVGRQATQLESLSGACHTVVAELPAVRDVAARSAALWERFVAVERIVGKSSSRPGSETAIVNHIEETQAAEREARNKHYSEVLDLIAIERDARIADHASLAARLEHIGHLVQEQARINTKTFHACSTEAQRVREAIQIHTRDREVQCDHDTAAKPDDINLALQACQAEAQRLRGAMEGIEPFGQKFPKTSMDLRSSSDGAYARAGSSILMPAPKVVRNAAGNAVGSILSSSGSVGLEAAASATAGSVSTSVMPAGSVSSAAMPAVAGARTPSRSPSASLAGSLAASAVMQAGTIVGTSPRLYRQHP